MPGARSDQEDLRRFGYGQELFRSMGGFSNFAISFSIISILTGAVTLYGYGLEMGGPLEMTLGWPVFMMSIIGLGAIVVRVRRFMPNLNPITPWLAQLGVCCFCIVWCLVFMKLSYDGRMARALVGNVEMKISTPSFGVFIALVCSIGGLGGTLMGLKDKTG